jgi:hypothetical protein
VDAKTRGFHPKQVKINFPAPVFVDRPYIPGVLQLQGLFMHKLFFRILPLFAFAATMAPTTVHAQGGPNDSAWIQLFNKKDTSLATDWDIKITTRALNVDPLNTFRWAVVGSDTVLEANISNYTNFNGQFGHIGYKHRPFNYFIVRVEHQFFGSQAPGNPGTWALQNNGIMHHSQAASTMGVNQDFPISMEAQLLGPSNTGADNNSTMNLCTPGTAFYTVPTGGSVNTNHCVSANGAHNRALALAPSWMTVKVHALSDSIIRYYYNNGTIDSLVYTYYRPVQYGGNVANATVPIVNGTPIKGGYMLFQSESHGTRFRKIEVLNLEGCMTPTDANYKTYFVKHDSTACGLPLGIQSPREARYAAPMTFIGGAVKVGGNDRVTLEVFDMSGSRIGRHTAQAPFQWSPAVKRSGVHVIRATTPKGTYTERATLF